MEPTLVVAKALLVYGPLGIFCVISLATSIKLYRDLQSERRTHAAEIHELQDRYIAKAETWMEKYHELAKSLNDVLESIAKRYEGRG